MKESVLSVLMYIFHHHMDKEHRVDIDDLGLVDDLKSVGFHALSIGKAFRWLHHLTELADKAPVLSKNSFRVFNDQEYWLLGEECTNFILSLEHQGILTPQTREIVIHQTLELISERVDINLIKWVTLMVLFNTPGCDDALTHMEFLIQSDAFDAIH